jgi:hypothetical protein
MIIYFEDDKREPELTVEILKKVLENGAKNANELHKSLKLQFGISSIINKRIYDKN